MISALDVCDHDENGDGDFHDTAIIPLALRRGHSKHSQFQDETLSIEKRAILSTASSQDED